MTMAANGISLHGLSRRWNEVVALDRLSLRIPAGKFTCLLGPSGCGKSTALRLIAGLDSPSDGTISIGDRDVTALPPSQRDIAMVFQSYALFPHLSVAENIIFGLRVRRVARDVRRQKLAKAAELLGLSSLLDRKPAELSGGQQQRVALGRAIVADKSIFLMDEPLSNLDAKLRAEMREEIRALQLRLGVTMVYVTHDQVEAVTMADHVVLMNAGKIEQSGTPRELYEQPQTLFAGRFIGTPPITTFSPRALGLDSPHVYGLRPEALQQHAEGALIGSVHNIEYLGADALVTVSVRDDLIVYRAPGKSSLQIGDDIRLSFHPQDLHVFDAASGQRVSDAGELPSLSAALEPFTRSSSTT